jgi:protein SCO1
VTRRRFLVLPALALAVALGVANRTAAADLRGGTFEPPRPAADFALRAADGSVFRLTHHRGKVIALTFGYTRCPDVCPTTLAELAQMRAHIGEAGKQVQVVYVTVDPDRDSPERMATYTRVFDRTFVGLSGPTEELERIWKAYGVSVTRRPSGGDSYTVHHSAVIYLIDRRGRLRALLPFGTAVSDIAHDVNALLQE